MQLGKHVENFFFLSFYQTHICFYLSSMYLMLDLTSVNVSLKRNWASQKLHVPPVSSGIISVLFLDVLFRCSSSSFAQLWCVIPSELEWRRVKTFHRCLFHLIHLDSSKSLETPRSDGTPTCGFKTTPQKKWASLSASGSCYNYISVGCNIWDLIREDYWGWISLSAVSDGEAHQLIYVLNSPQSLRNWKENGKLLLNYFQLRGRAAAVVFVRGRKASSAQ